MVSRVIPSKRQGGRAKALPLGWHLFLATSLLALLCPVPEVSGTILQATFSVLLCLVAARLYRGNLRVGTSDICLFVFLLFVFLSGLFAWSPVGSLYRSLAILPAWGVFLIVRQLPGWDAAWRSLGPWRPVLLLALLGVMGFTAPLGTGIACLVGVVALTRKPIRREDRKRVFLLAGALGLVAVTLVAWDLPRWGRSLPAWGPAFLLFWERPWIGWGSGAFSALLPGALSGEAGGPLASLKTGSDGLTWMVEYGSCGLVLLMGFLGGVVRALSRLKRAKTPGSEVLTPALLALGVASLLATPLQRPAVLWMVGVLLAGATWGLGEPRERRIPRSLGVLGAVLLVLLALLGFASSLRGLALDLVAYPTAAWVERLPKNDEERIQVLEELAARRHGWDSQWRVEYELADAYQRTGRLGEALEHLRRASRLHPRSVEVWALMGELLAREDGTTSPDRAAALEAYDRALGLRPEDTTIRLARAKALLAAGMRDKAEADLRDILRVSPDHEAARKLLGSVSE